MDLALLRTFVTVHRAGSFTRAAALLGLSQPAVTSQIRTLERQLGRPLFLRRARGVTPTTIGDELAHRAAPHLDALVEIAETGLDEGSGVRTLHIAGPPEFTALRALPALTPLVGQGLAVRTSFLDDTEEVLDGLAAGHHDLAVATARPRGDRVHRRLHRRPDRRAAPGHGRPRGEDRARQPGDDPELRLPPDAGAAQVVLTSPRPSRVAPGYDTAVGSVV